MQQWGAVIEFTGFLCAHRDAACGTRDYVRHRGIGVERQHIARSAAFAIAATAWIVWPPLFWHFGPGRELGGHTAWYWMSICTGILSGFGVAAWATSLPMLGSVRMAFGAMACTALLIGLNPLIGQRLWTFALGNPATLSMEPSRLVFVRSGAASLGALACWSLALALAGQAAFALRRAGAPRSRAMFWVVTILVTGLAGAIARVAIEPARRWRGYREAVPEGPPPLLSSGSGADVANTKLEFER